MDKAFRRARRKTALRGIATLLGLTRRGFFVPYRHAASLPDRPPIYAAFEAAFDACRPAMQQVLDRIEAETGRLGEAASGPLRDHWTGAYFGPLDASAPG